MITTFTLNHLGLVTGICNDLKIVETIDGLIPSDPQQKVTSGQAVMSMILNGLGFSNRQLYLYPQFFDRKPVELLIDKNINAEDLNDDTIGRALDRVFEYGCTELFCYVSHQATKLEKVDKKFGHLDTTTFSLHGDYENSEDGDAAISVTFGHSKAKRPDLRQIFLNLLVSFDGGVPVFMQALDGNSSDTTIFRDTVKEFKDGLRKNLQEITYLVADSKLYTKETLQLMDGSLLWISRVPDNITVANTAIEETAVSLKELIPLEKTGYSYRRHASDFGGVKQRWLVIHSEFAEERAKKTVERSVRNEYETIEKQTKKNRKKKFHCEEDARRSLISLQEKTKYHCVSIERIETTDKYIGRGRPSKSNPREKKVLYFAHHKIEADGNKIDLEIKKKSIFIIATNELSGEKLSDQEIFDNYKDQQKVERGFRFLKDPLFFASSLFLKKPERIVSLTMIMCLSLLVYSLCERKLRNLLKEHGMTIQNQIKKPTQKPTLRWIFQLFEDIHLVKIEKDKNVSYEIKNLRPDGEKVLRILGKNYMEPYLLK